MKRLSRHSWISVIATILFVANSVVFAASSSSCTQAEMINSSSGIQADDMTLRIPDRQEDKALPQLSNLRVVSAWRQPLLGGYVKVMRVPFFVSRWRWNSLKGAPIGEVRKYKDPGGNLVMTYTVPELDFAEMIWQAPQSRHLHRAIRNPNGSWLIAEYEEVTIEGNDREVVSSVDIYQCVAGRRTLVRSMGLKLPIAVGQQYYGKPTNCNRQ